MASGRIARPASSQAPTRGQILGRWIARTCPAEATFLDWLQSREAFNRWHQTHPAPATYSHDWWTRYLDGAE